MNEEIKNKFGTDVSYVKIKDKRFKKGYRIQENGRRGISFTFAELVEKTPRYLKEFPESK